MIRTRQDKTATTDAVELNDAALDQAAGGYLGGVYVAAGDVNGDTGYKPARFTKEAGSATPT